MNTRQAENLPDRRTHVQIPLWSMNTISGLFRAFSKGGSDSSMVDEYQFKDLLRKVVLDGSDSSMVDEYCTVLHIRGHEASSDSSMVDEYHNTPSFPFSF